MLPVIIVLILLAGIMIWKYIIPPANPFPKHQYYTAAWATLTSAAEKRRFRKIFRIDKTTNKILVVSDKKTYSFLQAMPNGVDVLNFRSYEPKEWTMDYFTPGAALREVKRKGKYLCRSKEDFQKVIDLFPHATDFAKICCLVKLFGLHAYGSMSKDNKKISEDVEVWVAVVNSEKAYKLLFRSESAGPELTAFSEIDVTLETPLLPMLVYEMLW